jgi:methionine-rich copper-binding protein CopC
VTGFRRAATAAALLLAPLTAAAAPAWAQGAIVDSSPVDGGVLTGPPSEVTLTFSTAVDVSASHADVSTGAGTAIEAGPLRPDGRTGVRLPLRITAAGDYLTAYHVVFTDGTVLIGVVRFSVGTGVPPPVSDAAARLAAQQAVAGHSHHDIDPFSAVLLLADGLTLIGVVLLLVVRRTPAAAPGEPDGAHH